MSKTIRVDQDVYDEIRASRRLGESMSKCLERLIKERQKS